MENPYIPKLAIIKDYRDETPDTRTFQVRFKDLEDMKKFKFNPGQFVELTVFGYGEAPFSISGGIDKEDYFELTIRKMGTVTSALFRMQRGSIIGIRGPLGRGWPIEKMLGKDILIIGGGIGIAPLRPVIHYIKLHREKFGKVILMYGARTPKDLLYKYEFDDWAKFIEVHLTVDCGDETWKGRVGVVTVLFDEIEVIPEKTIALQCGPPIMMHFVTKMLKKIGFPDENIYLSLERLMKCGMGFCGKCTISGTYVCRHGPVFCYTEVRGFLEKIPEAGE